MKQEKIEQIKEKLSELNWDDVDIAEIMEGFYNSLDEIIDINKCSEDHLKHLYELLGCEEQ